MAAVVVDPTLTVRSFLFGADGAGIAELATQLDQQGVVDLAGGALRRVARTGGGAVRAEVARAVQGLLEVDLGDIVLGAWRKWGALAAAARRTRGDPAATEVVSLAEHTVKWTSEPAVDLVVGELPVATVHFAASVAITLRGVAATVRGARLVALTGGSCEVSASLSVEDREVAERKREVRLPLLVRLGEGLPLLTAARPEPAATPARPPAAAYEPAAYEPASSEPAAHEPAAHEPASSEPAADEVAGAPAGPRAVRVALPGPPQPLVVHMPPARRHAR